MCFNRILGKPEIKPVGTINNDLARIVLLDKLGEMEDDKAEIYLPDMEIKIYKRDTVKNYLSLDETSKIVYVPEVMDCDDFAAILFGKFAGLVWTNTHALNWFYDEDITLWFIEPQSDKMSLKLENWQGWDIVFFLGR